MRAEGRSYRWIARELGITSLTSCSDTELTLRVSSRPQPEPTPHMKPCAKQFISTLSVQLKSCAANGSSVGISPFCEDITVRGERAILR